jgi:hypothetical protein
MKQLDMATRRYGFIDKARTFTCRRAPSYRDAPPAETPL